MLFVGGLGGLAAAVGLAYALLLGRGPVEVPAAPPPPTAPAPVELRIAAVVGDATVVRGAERIAARAGELLRPDDRIETAGDGRVELAAGEAYAVGLDGGARIEVKQIADELSRFRLESGLATARVRHDPRRAVEIEAAGAVARTRGGDLAVAATGEVAAVGVTRGEAEFTAGGETVIVRAGEQSIARAGGKPLPAEPIPRSLLLKVSWPGERVTNQQRFVVRGRTNPGAVLLVDGERVEVGPDGTFARVVYLREGTQKLRVRARDVGGRLEEVASPPVVLDTRAPEARFDTRGLWGK